MLPSELTLELWGGNTPALVLAQGENWVMVALAHIKTLVAALADAATDLAGVLAVGGQYHASAAPGRRAGGSGGREAPAYHNLFVGRLEGG